MQQRQLRLGDILDDYCPRERRVTNHAVVAMVGDDVKQTRCTTCDTEHEYKHAKVPRQRRKADTPAALYSQVLADAPKRVALHEHAPEAAAADDGHIGRCRRRQRQPTAAEDAVVPSPLTKRLSTPTATDRTKVPARRGRRTATDVTRARPIVR